VGSRQTGEQNAEDRSCDRRWVRARLWVGRLCGTGQWRGYCRIRALGRPDHADPRLVRARPAPTFWTLCARMRTRLVPALSPSTLPSQVMACRISSPRFPAFPFAEGFNPMTISAEQLQATAHRHPIVEVPLQIDRRRARGVEDASFVIGRIEIFAVASPCNRFAIAYTLHYKVRSGCPLNGLSWCCGEQK
jgi:hypothetical protein